MNSGLRAICISFAVLLILAATGITESAHSGPPYFSPDGDTVYFGNEAIVRARSFEQAPRAPALLGTAPDDHIATVWGPEVRLTFYGDTIGITSSPVATACGDTIFVAFSRNSYWASDAPFIMSSFDGGETWAEPWCITEDDSAQTTVNKFITYKRGRLNVGTTYIWPEGYSYYNTASKYSENQGATWSDPYFFFQLGQQYIGMQAGTSNLDTLLFGFSHGLDSWGQPVRRIKVTRSTNNGLAWSPLNEAVYYRYNNYYFWFKHSLGRVHLLYQETSPNVYLTEIFYTKSSDWGQNWSEPVIISDDSSQHSQWPYLSVSDDGILCASWFDYKYGGGGGGFAGDILFRISTDNGDTWGPELQLTNHHDATASRSFIVGDHIGLVWEDTRSGFLVPELYFAESFDLGQTWSSELRLTDAPGSSNRAELYLEGQSLYLFWLDGRDAPPFGDEIYLRMADIQTSVTDGAAPVPRAMNLFAYPNPFNETVTISLQEYVEADKKFDIFDICGRLIRTLKTAEGKTTWDATDSAGRKVTSGVYFARAGTPQGKKTIKLVLLR